MLIITRFIVFSSFGEMNRGNIIIVRSGNGVQILFINFKGLCCTFRSKTHERL